MSTDTVTATPSVYEFAIANTKAHIRSDKNQALASQGLKSLTAFEAADVLAIAFMKTNGEVIADLIRD